MFLLCVDGYVLVFKQLISCNFMSGAAVTSHSCERVWDFQTFFSFLRFPELLFFSVCVHVFDSSPRSPPLPLPLLLLSLLLLSCVPANAEQLDAQVVRPLLLFQVLDFITNSVGGGSKCVCVCVCAVVLVGESSRHLWAYLNGWMRHESLPSSSTERRGFAKRPAERRLSVWDHFSF